MRDLKGKHALVTGGAKGIGYATARRLLERGASVILWDLDEAGLRKAASELNELGAVETSVVDVADRAAVERAAEEALASGEVLVLVNNAGYVAAGDLLSLAPEQIETTISVNLTALLHTTRAFLPAMYERNEGVVVNVSSAAGVLGVPDLAAYSAAKWGVWGLTESLRQESIQRGKRGVRFSSIHPSYVATGMFEGARLPFPGNLISPPLKNHDVVAKAIVESAIRRGRYSPKRPRTVNLLVAMRGVLPDRVFNWATRALGATKGMRTFKGRRAASG
jgi:NAD(P)-dependent dehydrogenase (short-subunit alcohol dehydrogenase family)